MYLSKRKFIGKQIEETTTPAYEYAYEDYENPAPIQLRSAGAPCYEGDDCCKPKRRICKYLKVTNDTFDYDFTENDPVNLFIRNDASELCYEGDDCCNNDIYSFRVKRIAILSNCVQIVIIIMIVKKLELATLHQLEVFLLEFWMR